MYIITYRIAGPQLLFTHCPEIFNPAELMLSYTNTEIIKVCKGCVQRRNQHLTPGWAKSEKLPHDQFRACSAKQNCVESGGL